MSSLGLSPSRLAYRGEENDSLCQLATGVSSLSFSKNPERAGFEPAWLAPIRFRGGAVMTASVPLLKIESHFSKWLSAKVLSLGFQ